MGHGDMLLRTVFALFDLFRGQTSVKLTRMTTKMAPSSLENVSVPHVNSLTLKGHFYVCPYVSTSHLLSVSFSFRLAVRKAEVSCYIDILSVSKYLSVRLSVCQQTID